MIFSDSDFRGLQGRIYRPLAASLAALLACALLPAALADEDAEEEKEPQKSDLVQEVLVTASRVDEGAPATFTNISEEAIDEEYYAQEIPALLRIAPSVYSYSDAGNDIGYAYLSVRGFDQPRVAVTVNGIPLNGSEHHQVYWIDLPNFPDSLEDVQIQRGAGTSIYGGNPIGGAINLETARLTPGERFGFELGYGSYSTSKLATSWVSDLVADRWVFGAQLSRIDTDGYRERSWAELTSGFFTAQRIGERSLLRINAYGGLEETHLSYEGLTRAQLAENRRFNPFTWEGEIDHFVQPHFEVLHEYRPREGLEIANTFYVFTGSGYYDQFRPNKAFGEVRLPNWDVDGDGTEESSGEIYRRRQVDEWDAGWIPRVTLDHGSGRFTAGASLRFHRGAHYGEITGGDIAPEVGSGYRYYEYEVPKSTVVVFAQEEWRPTARLRVSAGLQYVTNDWKLEKAKVTGYSYDVDYSWFAPRLGVSYIFSDALSGFVSFAHSRREPVTTNLYDPADTWSIPAFSTIGEDGRLRDPLVEEEKLDDYELGLSYQTPRLLLKATLYNMEFRDELVYLGQQNDLGDPITGNAERSVHRGLELELAATLAARWSVAGHATFSQDELEDFVVIGFDPVTWEPVPIDYSGNRIAGFPNVLARLALSYRPSWGRVELAGRHTGRIYLDNSEDRYKSTDPYTVVDLGVRYRIPGTEGRYSVSLRVNNLLDEEYESYGYAWTEEPTFIPAAGRHAFLMLSFKPGS